MRTAATNPRRAVAGAWDEAEAVQWSAPDSGFAPPPDDIDPDDIRAVRGWMVALLLSVPFWLVVVWWLT